MHLVRPKVLVNGLNLKKSFRRELCLLFIALSDLLLEHFCSSVSADARLRKCRHKLSGINMSSVTPTNKNLRPRISR